MVGGLILLFSNRGWQAQELSPELGSVGKDFVNLERAMKHGSRVGGTFAENSSSRRSPHLKMFILVAGVIDRHWSSKSHQKSSVTSFAYLRSVVHFCA